MVRKKGSHRAVLATAMMLALVLPLAPAALAEGPSIQITTPLDGTSTTTPGIVVSGTAKPAPHTTTLDRTELGTQPGMNMAWGPAGLVMRPIKAFHDDFSCSTLDMSKWVILRDTGSIAVVAGTLVLAWESYADPVGLIRSVGNIFPMERDWTAIFDLKMTSQFYYLQCGAGITRLYTDWASSAMSVETKFVYPYGTPNAVVYARGAPVYNFTNDGAFHEYTLDYTKATGVYTVYFGENRLATFTTNDVPSFFWFGQPDTGATYYYPVTATIDEATVWTQRGTWTSETYDIGHQAVIDSATATWTTSNPSAAKVVLEARASSDNSTWSEWTAISAQGSESPLAGRYVQMRLMTSLPKVYSETAHITFSSVDLSYHFPLVSVEARREGGDWVTATGLERWSASLTLEEDENVVEVRATDTSGATTTTSITHIVDTTPPVGTVEIMSDGPYTNDLNVTLKLEATDRWGVSLVQVSSAPDMYNKRTFPYSEKIPWRLEGVEGEVPVYVRFVDSNGLVGGVVTDSIIFDGFPPIGRVTINDGAEYTDSTTVKLNLEYSDAYGVAKVELANRPDLSDAQPLRGSSKVVEGWELLGGGDGRRTVYMRLTDIAGNVGIITDSIELVWPKAYGSVTLEGGAKVTSKAVVSARLECPPELRATRMELSNDAAFATSKVDTYQKDYLWILSPGDGPKTVFVRFEDHRGLWTLPVSSSILLDTAPPVVSVTLGGGARYTTQENQTASVTVEDDSQPVRMWLSGDGRFEQITPTAFAGTVEWRIGAWEGDHYLHVQVEDAAGNLGVGVGSIHFATIRPKLTLALPDGPLSNAEGAIAVTAQVQDPYGGIEVQLAFNEDPAADAPWHPAGYALSVAVPLDTPDGTYQVRGRARNAAGLGSDVAWVAVTLDRVAPSLNVYEPPEGGALRQKALGVQLKFTAEDLNGISAVNVKVNGDDWTTLDKEDRQAAVSFDDFGRHTITVRVVDGAGNAASESTTFNVEEAGAVVAGGGGGFMGILLILLVVIVAGVVALRMWSRHRVMASPETAQVAGATGEEPAEPEVAAEEQSGPAPRPTGGLEPVHVEEPPAPVKTSDWEEF